MSPEILVIGALGNVGAEVVNALAAQGASVRAADLFPDKINARFGPNVEAVRFQFGSPETYAPAFAGIRKLFLLRPPQITNIQRDMIPAMEAAQAAGVQHVVFLSLIGIEQNTRVPHYQVEQWLQQSGLDYTFLRASFFMQNMNTTHRQEIREQDEIFVPVGAARTSFIDVRDIGAVAALALTQPGHAQKAYNLTGPEALDYDQVADLFTAVLGRPIRYKNPSALAFFMRQLRSSRNPMYAFVTTWLYNNTRKGMAATVTADVERLLGRPPISMQQYIQDYRASWLR